MEIKISFNLDHINHLMKLLGDMPTSSMAWPIMMSIKEQAEADIKRAQEEQGEEPTVEVAE